MTTRCSKRIVFALLFSISCIFYMYLYGFAIFVQFQANPQDNIDSVEDHVAVQSAFDFQNDEKWNLVDSLDVYPAFDFQNASWTNSEQYFWNPFLENRYKNEKKKFPLKIIVIPHSHNDPGWGLTYEEYFRQRTRDILNFAVDKLVQYPNMTFQWSEASFMSTWWQNASEQRKTQFKKLVDEKRLEIVTGGWVMTDEAIVPLYSMVDQLIEGQHWFKYHLDIFPKVSWSVDPFGHGSTFPYLLKLAGIDSMVILRIHYAWKKWLGENRKGDFKWVQRWDTNRKYDILCHQVFFNMYLIANSLGPHNKVCRTFDFITDNKRGILDRDLQQMATTFVEEAGRTASLFDHNVALPILGSDFAFRNIKEWDRTYSNYMKLFEYINSNKEKFNAEASFGTLSDYFEVIRKRQTSFGGFSGDFFPYSDTEVSKALKRTSYWTGFYSSRPFWKKMHRETENAVRTAEILFSFSNILTKSSNVSVYTCLVQARQYLALFAHHDAAPGVSGERIMTDYRKKLNVAIESSLSVQTEALKNILVHLKLGKEPEIIPLHRFSNPLNTFRDGVNITLDMTKNKSQQILLFNSLGWENQQYIKILVNSPSVGVKDAEGNFINCQLNPVIEFVTHSLTKSKSSHSTLSKTRVLDSKFELVFIATLPPLAISTIYTVEVVEEDSINIAKKGKIVTNVDEVNSTVFTKTVEKWSDVDMVFIKNDAIELGFSATSGFMQQMKKQNKITKLEMSFGGYVSVIGFSGPYLFMPNDTRSIKVPLAEEISEIVVIEGPISSEILVSYYPRIRLAVRILHEGSQEERDAVFIENKFDCSRKDGEYYMRLNTSLKTLSKSGNGKETDTFYTDQSGYTFEKRVIVDSVGVQGNYYPVTTMFFVEDEGTNERLSLLVDRSHGATAFSGALELMIERYLLYDDNRGIGQGIFDTRLTTSNYILKLETLVRDSEGRSKSSKLIIPSLQVQHLSQYLIYPPSKYLVNSSTPLEATKSPGFRFLNKDIPKDTTLLNLRTLPEFPKSANSTTPFVQSCSSKVLMIFQKMGYSCSESTDKCDYDENDTPLFLANSKLHDKIFPKVIQRTDITGLRDYSSVFPDKNDVVADINDISCHRFELIAFKATF